MILANETFHFKHSMMVQVWWKECAPSFEIGIESGKLIINRNSR